MKVKGIRDRCYYCAKQEKCTKDHFIPRSKGGTLTAWACKKCQNTKKDLMPLDWLEIIHTIPEYKGKEDRIKTSVLSLLEWIKLQKENRLKYGLRSNLKLNE